MSQINIGGPPGCPVVVGEGRTETQATDTLATLRTQKYVAAKSGLLMNLPPTDDALEQHIKRSALATIITKSFQHHKTLGIDFEYLRWIFDDRTVRPRMMTSKTTYS